MKITGDMFMPYKTLIADGYVKFVTYRFEAIVKALPNQRLSAIKIRAVNRDLEQDWALVRNYVTETVTNGQVVGCTLNVEAVQRMAVKTAQESIDDLVAKLDGKLGDHLVSVDVKRAQGDGFLLLSGELENGSTVVVEQNKILNVSSKGMLYHQWPARIKVNGKPVSEAAFKKLLTAQPG
jgi:hypothetical protein